MKAVGQVCVLLAPFAAFAFAAQLSACSHKGAAPSAETPPADAGVTADIQVLSLSTWLGQLDPTPLDDDAGAGHQFGGLATLASYFKADRATNPSTVLVLGSDSWGASPPLSAEFQDVPAVKGLGYLGADVDMLSNHNFDNGTSYIQNLIDAGSYPYVASNLAGVQTQVSSAVVTPYQLVNAGPVKVGLIGLTDPNAPNKTFPGNFGSITISEPVAAANVAAKQAREAGALVVIAATDLATTGIGIAGVHTGPLIDFASGLVGVDVVLGYNQSDPATPLVGSVLVVEHLWKGETYGRTSLHLENGVLKTATAVVVYPDVAAVTPDPGAVALLAPYRTQLTQALDGVLSVTTGAFPLDGTERVAETALGDLLADAFLARYASGGAQVAIINGAGIRGALPSSYAPVDTALRRPASGYAAGPPYDVVVGDVYTILPFDDFCIMRAISGATLWLMLEESVSQEPAANNGFLQIAGFKFTYQLSAPVGARVQSVTLDDGTAIGRSDTTAIMLVDSDYLDAGGDDYGMLVQSPAAARRDVEATVLRDYLKANPQLTPSIAGRVTQVP
jgi:5'-nucleotidase